MVLRPLGLTLQQVANFLNINSGWQNKPTYATTGGEKYIVNNTHTHHRNIKSQIVFIVRNQTALPQITLSSISICCKLKIALLQAPNYVDIN